MSTISVGGALIALSLAIILILKKVSPVYGMILGALIGGVVGGADLVQTISLMIEGAKNITPAIMRILAAGVLAGVLIESGAANTIAETIVHKLGETRALLAIALATLILTAVGVFVDVAVITVSPIAIALAKRGDLSKSAILLAMVGGGKAGNIISPNPNTIAASDAFHVSLTSVMTAGVIPALFGLILSYLLAKKLKHRGTMIHHDESQHFDLHALPKFLPAISAPLFAILFLAFRPLFDIPVDPLIALPLGACLGALCMGKWKELNHYSSSGLSKMTSVAIMLLGTGTLAGVIGHSELTNTIVQGLQNSGMPSYLLAPISGILMSLATSSTTAGTVVASNVFGTPLLELGVPALAAAAMIHVGATVGDHMPHGSFFHATGGSVNLDMRERLKLIPYETLIGLIMTFISVLIFGVLH